jgi:catechol 2,3-dioxygenase-like lactoylglutathione lyase family enzyme
MSKRAAVLVLLSIAGAAVVAVSPSRADAPKEVALELGNFSVSLAVKDLEASRAFYERLGFRAVFGEAKQHWLILQNGTATIGLFQGGIERNTLTFNPGWTREAKPLETFQDVRDIQRLLKERGIVPTLAADESSTGPAAMIVTDPDGNPVLVDQHVARPKR